MAIMLDKRRSADLADVLHFAQCWFGVNNNSELICARQTVEAYGLIKRESNGRYSLTIGE